MTAIVSRTKAVYELSHTNGRHVKTPTIACDECGRRYTQARCRPWQRNQAWPEVMLCGSAKKGCMHDAMVGMTLRCYGESVTSTLERATAEEKLAKQAERKHLLAQYKFKPGDVVRIGRVKIKVVGIQLAEQCYKLKHDDGQVIVYPVENLEDVAKKVRVR